MSLIPEMDEEAEVTVVVCMPPSITRRLEARRERLERRRRAAFKAWWQNGYAAYVTLR